MALGKYFYIVSRTSGLVMEVTGEAPGSMVVLALKQEGEQGRQLWYADSRNDRICSRLSDHCLDIDAVNSVCARPPQHGHPHQKWKLDGITITNPATHQVLDVAGSNPFPGAPVTAWVPHGGLSQQWLFEYVPAKFFLIKSRMHNKVVTLQEPHAGAKVVMNVVQVPPANSQQWYEDTTGVIRCKLKDLALDCSDGNVMRAQQYGGSPGQQWVHSGDSIINKHETSKCLHIRGKNMTNGAVLCPFQYKGQVNQHWQYVYL